MTPERLKALRESKYSVFTYGDVLQLLDMIAALEERCRALEVSVKSQIDISNDLRRNLAVVEEKLASERRQSEAFQQQYAQALSASVAQEKRIAELEAAAITVTQWWSEKVNRLETEAEAKDETIRQLRTALEKLVAIVKANICGDSCCAGSKVSIALREAEDALKCS